MAVKDEIKWFKDNFSADVIPALAGTPLSFDLICAITFQESGELWSRLRRDLPREEVLRLSVGDTLDEPNRSAFPKNKDALIGVDGGQEMFDLASYWWSVWPLPFGCLGLILTARRAERAST